MTIQNDLSLGELVIVGADSESLLTNVLHVLIPMLSNTAAWSEAVKASNNEALILPLVLALMHYNQDTTTLIMISFHSEHLYKLKIDILIGRKKT